MIAYPCALCTPPSPTTPYAYTVIDGVPLCAPHARSAATAKLGPQEPSPADMTIREETLDGHEIVVVPEKAKDLLIALGWTLPGDEPATVVLPPLEGQLPIVEVYRRRFQVLGWDFDDAPGEAKATLRLGPSMPDDLRRS